MHTIKGTVYRDNGRGRDLGYPTANILYSGNEKDGVYISRIKIEGDEALYPSLAFIGAAETFGETKRKLEVWIMDFNRDIYEKEISVELLKHTRGSMKFNSLEELVVQMKEDERQGREYFATLKP